MNLDPGQKTVNGRRDVLTVILPGEDPRRAILLGILAFRAGFSVSGEQLGDPSDPPPPMLASEVVRLLHVRWSAAKELLATTRVSQELLRTRFRHRSGFLRIPRKLIGMRGLSCLDLCVAGRIEATKSRTFVPAIRHLSDDIGVPKRNVERSLAKLRRLNVLRQEKASRPGCRNLVRRALTVPDDAVEPSRAARSSRSTLAESICTVSSPAPVAPAAAEGWTKKLAKAQAQATFMLSSPEDQRIFKALGLLGIYERSNRARGEMATSLANVHNYLLDEILEYAAVVGADPATRNAPARFAENLRHPERLKILVKRREHPAEVGAMLAMLAKKATNQSIPRFAT